MVRLNHERLMALVGLLGGLAGALTAGTVVGAESREKVRLDLLDTCVYDQWKKQTAKDAIVENCKCAAEAAAGEFSDDQVADFNGQLTRSEMPLWQEAFAECFRS